MSSADNSFVGQVKWFNNKTGYGFITVSSEGEHSGKDIFTHFSAISVGDSQYKYLVQGEYVQFGMIKPESGSHEFQATNVSGINGGRLMCETRNMNQTNRRPRKDNNRRTRRPDSEQAESSTA